MFMPILLSQWMTDNVNVNMPVARTGSSGGWHFMIHRMIDHEWSRAGFRVSLGFEIVTRTRWIMNELCTILGTRLGTPLIKPRHSHSSSLPGVFTEDEQNFKVV